MKKHQETLKAIVESKSNRLCNADLFLEISEEIEKEFSTKKYHGYLTEGGTYAFMVSVNGSVVSVNGTISPSRMGDEDVFNERRVNERTTETAKES